MQSATSNLNYCLFLSWSQIFIDSMNFDLLDILITQPEKEIKQVCLMQCVSLAFVFNFVQ